MIFDKSFTPPTVLETERFVVFPTSLDHYLSDYEAVMASRHDLRIWSCSTWPEDSFTPEENRADLAHHVEDNLNHSTYGYMIYDPKRKYCYGSLYLSPMSTVLNNYEATEEQKALLAGFDARADYWIRTGEVEIEAEISRAFLNWFRDEWKIRAVFAARPLMHQRLAILDELDLNLVARLKSSSTELILAGL